MARILLNAEFTVNANGATPEGGCFACLESRLDGHRSDCALVYVLNKAGIRDLDVQPQPPSCGSLARITRMRSGKQVIANQERKIAELEAEIRRLKGGAMFRLRERLASLLSETDEEPTSQP